MEEIVVAGRDFRERGVRERLFEPADP